MTNKHFSFSVFPLLTLLMLIGFCVPKKREINIREVELVKRQYVRHIEHLDSAVNELKNTVATNAPSGDIQQAFFRARLAYKQIEFLAEYYNPYTAKAINGPAIDEVEPDDPNEVVVSPTGFQVVEEVLFPVYDAQHAEEALREIGILHASINRLKLVMQTTDFTDQHLFDAMRQEVNRIITLGIAGFDSPVAFYSLSEAAAAIQSLEKSMALYAPRLKKRSPEIAQQVEKALADAENYLRKSTDFIAFDRAEFITDYANPLATALLEAQQALGIAPMPYLRAVSSSAPTLFAENAFNPNFYAPGKDMHPTPDRVELGKMLFFDPVLSGNGSRSCASCHKPEKAFTDGQNKSVAFNFKGQVNRNAPTILNAAMQRALFHDLRVSFLEDQASDVLANEVEMHGSLTEAVNQLKESPEYTQLFTAAFPKADPDEVITERHLKVAIASYVRSLTSFNSRFDQYMRGDKTKLTALEKTGFNLFMGKAKCATCHFTPLFNGTVPPTFDNTEAEIIGVPATTDTLNPVLDPDLGKFALYNKELHKFAFKTPTVRNVELTAPYMHNGVYQSLEEVVEFYNKGGGQGLGIDLPTQTLPAEPLDLTKEEKAALVAFMRSLTDTSAVKGSVPERLPAFPGKVALTGRKIGGKY